MVWPILEYALAVWWKHKDIHNDKHKDIHLLEERKSTRMSSQVCDQRLHGQVTT